MTRLLLVDDEPNMRRVLRAILEPDGHVIVEADGVVAARAALAREAFDAVLTDHKMLDGNGLDVLHACADVDTNLQVVLLTAFADDALAVEVMRQGAFDFLAKPFEPGIVRVTVQRAVERATLERENARLRGTVERLAGRPELLGDSSGMRAVRETVGRVAPTAATVLITGETGTGKELVARAIHALSPRADEPFIAVNCAAMTETLLESELFGHEKGAFTGADHARQGVFEAADHGTLFLDEAGEMSLALQAKLLRVLQDGEIVRVGATAPRRVDVRVVAATHRDLAARVREGSFREDLYYRLAVVPLAVPPLRERAEDIPVLLGSLLHRVAREMAVPARGVEAAVIPALQAYAFPGNVRELRNLVERACILARGESLTLADFPSLGEGDLTAGAPGDAAGYWERCAARAPSGDLRDSLDAVERALILQALGRAGGVQAEAARALGVSRSDLSYKLKRLGVDAAARSV